MRVVGMKDRNYGVGRCMTVLKNWARLRGNASAVAPKTADDAENCAAINHYGRSFGSSRIGPT